MSYVDALYDRDRDRIHIVKRNENGDREYEEYPANYVFYYEDLKGKHKTIFGDSVSRFSSRSMKEFRKEMRMYTGTRIFESDINPVFRCLAEHYQGFDAPKLNVAFFDIETDFDADKGFSPPSDPFNEITAITVYCNWIDKLVTLAIPPKTLSMESAEEQCVDFDNTFIFETEAELLNTFLDLIQDADVLTGWNSEGYDIPYTVNRVTRVLSKDDTRRFCLWDQLPKKRMFERFGSENETFDLIGRVHLDYMQLYRKYTYEERHSYALDAIGDYENLGSKTTYEGTLDQLYNNDFKKFIEYNRQDVVLLKDIDNKLKFLDLANTLAHENTVLLPTTMGAVAVTEQAIINEAHEQGLVVPSRRERSDGSDTQAAGAYVAYPKKGLHDWIGSIDINSLYPSAIRALNMGPETIIGQIRPDLTDQHCADKMAKGASFAASWEGLFGTLEYTAVMEQNKGVELTVDWESGGSDTMSGAKIWKLVFDSNNPWVISANGTIFTYEKKGIIPGLLERWYAERKVMQKKLRECDESEKEYWDKRQLVKKINLNSLYGAILNPGCRFFDKRIGQSTTLTGRTIVKHMDAYVNECLTGKYDHVGKSIIYGDTDSVYFSAYPILKDDIDSGKMKWNKEICLKLYDSIAEQVNISFPGFMEQAFHCPRAAGQIIKGGREIVATKGLFITKKRYAALIYDLEGNRLDVNGKPGKVKAMGLDLKRSDTPRVIQDFLSDVLLEVLNNAGKDDIIKQVREFKLEFTDRPGWEKGSPKRVNNLTMYSKKEKAQGKANMPGHVRAAMNWNSLKRMNSDRYSQDIVDGMKVIVCKLKQNPLQYTSVAYPTDEAHIPNWFKELPFDNALMEATIIDKKLDNLIGVLDWDLASETNTENTFQTLFEF